MLCIVILSSYLSSMHFFLFFSNHTATTEIYTLSLHDALPISVEKVLPRRPCRHQSRRRHRPCCAPEGNYEPARLRSAGGDRKSTRLNSSHQIISYAVFCLKKKKKNI